MINGTSKLNLTESDMIEIVQHYLDTVMLKDSRKVEVTGVTGTKVNMCQSFVIDLTGRQDDVGYERSICPSGAPQDNPLKYQGYATVMPGL